MATEDARTWPRLSFSDCLDEAGRLVLARMRYLLLLVGLPAAVYLAVLMAWQWFSASGKGPLLAEEAQWAAVSGVAYFAAIVCLTVALHRLFILGGSGLPAGIPVRLGVRELKFTALAAGLCVVTVVPTVIVAMAAIGVNLLLFAIIVGCVPLAIGFVLAPLY